MVHGVCFWSRVYTRKGSVSPFLQRMDVFIAHGGVADLIKLQPKLACLIKYQTIYKN